MKNFQFSVLKIKYKVKKTEIKKELFDNFKDFIFLVLFYFYFENLIAEIWWRRYGTSENKIIEIAVEIWNTCNWIRWGGEVGFLFESEDQFWKMYFVKYFTFS